MRSSLLLAVLLVMLGAAPVFAQAPDGKPEGAPDGTPTASADTFFLPEYQDPATERPSSAGNALGFLIKFGGVIGLIYGVFWVYRRMGGPALAGTTSSAGPSDLRVRTLGSTHLRGAQTVHLVSVGDRVWVVGSNGKDMLVPLGELSPEEGKEAFAAHLAAAENESEGFDALVDATLRQVMIRRKGERA
jgi:flagellar biogenesis protein FliO